MPEISIDFINNWCSRKTKASADDDAQGFGARLLLETCRVPEPGNHDLRVEPCMARGHSPMRPASRTSDSGPQFALGGLCK